MRARVTFAPLRGDGVTSRPLRGAGFVSLDLLLFGLFFLPALAVAWGSVDGEVAFVLYREPKLACLAVLGWGFLATLLWREGHRLAGARVAATLTHPVVASLGLFIAWSAVTAGWVTVHRNLSYELSQLVLLFFLVVCLRAHPGAEGRWRRAVENGLIASLAVLTGIGLIQGLGGLPGLAPIDPQYGSLNPSLMGYKNPMALALVGQFFLLAGRVATATGRWRWPWLALLIAEGVYLMTLLSRTAYLAFAAGGLALLAMLWWRRSGEVRWARVVTVFLVLAVGVAAIAWLHPGAQARLASAASFVMSPQSYLETDRGVYLKNTVNMARHRPWGVGLGDWQTHYPVYRLHDRYRAYDDEFQVRRAHSDHVQVLGETGWLGFALWVGFWVIALRHAWRRAVAARGGATAPLTVPSAVPLTAAFASAQLVAFAAAMATDYVIEIPYLKLQFFGVLFLTLGPPVVIQPMDESPFRYRRWLAAMVTVLALLVAAQSVAGVLKSRHAAALSWQYLRALEVEGPERKTRLQQAAAEGRRFARLPGHEKTAFRSWLVLADTWLRTGRLGSAEAAARRALALHPFHPGTYRFLAKLEGLQGNREEAQRWDSHYRAVMHQTSTGPPVGLESTRIGGKIP